MATITKTFSENGGSGTRGSWTLSISGTDYVLSSNSFNLYEMLSCNARYTNSQTRGYGYTRATFYLTVGTGTGRIYFLRGDNGESGRGGCVAMASGTSYVIPKTETIVNTNPVYTSWLFNSNNPTDRTYEIVASITSSGIFLRSCNSTMEYDTSYSSTSAETWGTIAKITLDVPPIGTVSAISYDKPFIYAGLTTASVTVSDTTAYYGGSVTDVTFKIGSQTASLSGDGTLSIALDTAGTFTPTVTVTDSRGQTKVYSLSPITVLSYTAPTVNFTADRTTSTGVPDDEGTYATCPSTFIFADAIADLIAPSVVLTDENGTQTTPTVSWYATRATDGTLSGVISDWSSVSAGDTVYGLVSGLNTNYSYQISIRPRDSQGTGTAITQTVASAFYTIDFLAGGHGIAFGQPSSQDGFECNMPTTFHDTVDCEDALTAPDMSAQEVDDFIDSIGGGDPIADVVVEQGVDGIWTYRKWSSGIAECWASYSYGSISAGGPIGGYYYGFTSAIAFPFTYSSAPSCTASCKWGTGYAFCNARDVTTTSVTVQTYKNQANADVLALRLYAIGEL